MVGYLPIQLCTYIPIWLYSYTPMCLQRPPLGVLLSAWLLDSRRGGCCLTQVMFVRGGDGALTRTRVVAPGSSIHTRRVYMPSLVICRPVFLCHCEVMGGGAGGWGFFLCVFSGFSSLCLLCFLFWGGIKSVPAFLVCACGCVGRTMGCIKLYDFGCAGLPPCFLKRSVNE